MLKISFSFLCLFTALLTSNVSAQPPGVRYYKSLEKIIVFESHRMDIESVFKYSVHKESAESDGSKTVYYELKGAKLSVYYSTGRCSEHKSKLGFDVNRDVIIGMTLDFYDDVNVSKFNFDLRKFRKYIETENNAVHYNSEELGIELTGGPRSVSSITLSGSESQRDKYRCK